MQSHAAEGRKLLMSNQQITPATVDVAYSHHERVDGKGYPRGLDAARIPYFAKIVAVADSYDAINSDRVYSKGKSSLESLRILLEAVNSHFDEAIVGCFIRMIGIYPPGEIAELSTGEVGIIIGCPAGNKLKPKILIVRDAEKKPCKERVVDLADAAVCRTCRVREVHGSGVLASISRRTVVRADGPGQSLMPRGYGSLRLGITRAEPDAASMQVFRFLTLESAERV